MNVKTRFSIYVVALLLLALTLSGCSFYNRITGRNNPERIERRQQRQFEKQHAKLKEKHIEMQSERTKEMIKRSEKRQKRLNRHKKRSWIEHVLGIGD